MSQTKAHPVEEKKKTGGSSAGEKAAPVETVPAPEKGSHAQSHAAHLHANGEDVHTEPAGNKHRQVEPGALRQPASIPQRNGKQHR